MAPLLANSYYHPFGPLSPSRNRFLRPSFISPVGAPLLRSRVAALSSVNLKNIPQYTAVSPVRVRSLSPPPVLLPPVSPVGLRL